MAASWSIWATEIANAMPPTLRLLSTVVLAVSLAACGGGNDPPAARAGSGDTTNDPLPAPARASGAGVTGMPGEPGPNPIGVPDDATAEPAVVLDESGGPVPVDGVEPPPDGLPVGPAAPPMDTGALPPASVDGQGPQEAVAVVRDYYAAINAGSFGRAYALWADGGRASGRSPQQFADGFAQTADMSVEVMPPGRVEAAAGSRRIEVPVAVTATRRDGGQLRYVGAYLLQRAVDGASPEQRAWRIVSADLREVRP